MSDNADFEQAKRDYGHDSGRAAFSRLVKRHQNSLVHQVLASTKDRSRSLEIVQESFLRAYKSIPSAKTGTNFRAWVGMIARNLCIDEARKRKPQQSLDSPLDGASACLIDLIPAESPTPAQRLENAEALKVLRNGLRRLRPISREVIELRQFQGLSYREIGVILHCTEKAAKQRMYQALCELKKSFKKDADF